MYLIFSIEDHPPIDKAYEIRSFVIQNQRHGEIIQNDLTYPKFKVFSYLILIFFGNKNFEVSHSLQHFYHQACKISAYHSTQQQFLSSPVVLSET